MGNIAAIWSRQPASGFEKLLTGNTSRDLSAGTSYTIFTADAVFGSRVDRVMLQPLGTNTATVVRIFMNNGGAISTGTNNVMIREVTMSGTTASEVSALLVTEVLLELGLKAGHRLVCSIGTTVAAGIGASAHGGDY